MSLHEVVVDEISPSEAVVDGPEIPDEGTAAPEEEEVIIEEEGTKPPEAPVKKWGGKFDSPEELESAHLESQKQLLEVANELKEVKKALASPKPVKDEKVDEAELTDDQLAAYLKENEGDPRALMQVVNYKAAQIAKKERSEAESKYASNEAAQKLHSIQQAALQDFPEVDESPEISNKVDNIAKSLGLEGHPAMRLIGLGIYKLWESSQKASKDAADSAREGKLKKEGPAAPSKGPVSTKSKTVTLTAEQMAFAKEKGIDPKKYARFVPKEGA